ncbi:hypothetical protein FKZ61_007995 [Litorilinea aerophila]|uniref:Uncharacterized protein n=1 Tax=Litorilinea aerophila TaxID=1204385 RepID=A0A540VIA0_9CHLR|nr:hypothetical protein [Litorilinea aerophila]MCC9076050.1 hypothetical protein [Litorilinea aerophila]
MYAIIGGMKAIAQRFIRSSAVDGPEADLYQFTVDFFTFFGAQVRRLDRSRQGPLQVQLPPEMAEHFGRSELRLAFRHVEDATAYDLVAHGSRLFDRMLAWLERRAAFTLQQLPRRVTASEALMQAVRPVNASITGLRLQEQFQPIFVFNWRLTYRADDKREELYTVLLDEEGHRIPQPDEPQAPAHALDLEQLLADAQPFPPADSGNGDGQPKLPPLTRLVRLAEAARKYAIYHADLRCAGHEAEIYPRLYKVLNRLTTYYRQQIEEVYDASDPTGEKRRALEEDLARKIAEEVENHRLRVQVHLFSYAILHVPVAVADLTLSDGRQEAAVQVRLNRYTGQLHRPTCHACGQETEAIALDARGHVTCDACLLQCASCLAVVCASCGVAACPHCGRENCDACSEVCWACGERACQEHISTCPVCGDRVCHQCQACCDHCGVRQCRTHLRVDAVAMAHGEPQQICADCAVRCPGCHQYSAQTGLCAASGQRFCQNCLVTCAGCGVQVGPGFYHRSEADGQAYCLNCLVECPACGRQEPAIATCVTCGADCCPACGHRCVICDQLSCAQHGAVMAGCGHGVCAAHVTQCVVGQEPVCPLCEPACGICQQHACAAHRKTCRRCGQEYCQECVRLSGFCDTCATIGRDGEVVQLSREPWGEDPRVAALAPGYHWLRAANHRYVIYVGQSLLGDGAIVVVDRGAEPPQVVVAEKSRRVDFLRHFFGQGP